MYKTFKATGLCLLILQVVTWWTRKEKAGKFWFVYNPFRRQIQSLVPYDLPVQGNIYRHEIDGHGGQLDRYGLVRFCVGTVGCLVIFMSYWLSPLEIEARSKENK